MEDLSRGRIREAMVFRSSPPPPRDDLAGTVAWLRDRELIKDVYSRYAFGVDSINIDLLRESVFHPDCVIVGTMEEGSLDDYLQGLAESLPAYGVTMHFKGNQYVELEGDKAFVETWVIGYHVEKPGSPLQDLHLAVRYMDDMVRHGDDWRIIRRVLAKQWHTGPLPRPLVGDPPYPRGKHESRIRQAGEA
jgi:hypothetical protein